MVSPAFSAAMMLLLSVAHSAPAERPTSLKHSAPTDGPSPAGHSSVGGSQASAAAASTTVASANAGGNSVYERPLAITYALDGNKGMNYSDSDLLSYFSQVNPGITSMVPFFLNVANPSDYDSIVKNLQQMNIVIIPAVGKAPNFGNIDSQDFMNIVKGYKPYSDYIRLEGMQGYYDIYGTGGIQNMINYCVSLGFQHIMLNPWPETADHKAVSFNNSQVDSTILQVSLEQNRQTSEPISDPTNWYPANPNKIDSIRDVMADCEILINYESATQLLVLDNLEKAQKGGSITAMQITVNQIDGPDKAENLHWIPPFDQVYDPIALGTWDWMASTLSKM